MGGGASKPKPQLTKAKINAKSDENGSVKKSKDDVESWSIKKIINKKCPTDRYDHCNEVSKLEITGGKSYDYSLRYCYVSQRGYYPNAMGKANQDSYVICEGLLNDNNNHLFGIFDGHGEYGDYCSYYAANNVPYYLEKEIQAAGGLKALDGPNLDKIYSKAFTRCNKSLHKSNIDDSLSGTTGISVIVHGDTLFVANVGDSRAIIASEIDGKLKYAPLSDDQTPFRKDERERLKKEGARIMTLEQIEGNEPIHENWGAETGDFIDESGNPPRVWDSSLERPGCAFTRSIGDAVAEDVGVHAEPELLTWKLSPNDKFCVIASDGVFEFLTSQAVVDIVSKFSSPLEAAKHIVQESYRLWLTYDERTDDISIIVVNFDNFKQKVDIITPTENRIVNETVSKPVRRVLSKAKRQVVSENWAEDEKDNNFDINANSTPKSSAEIARISDMIKANFMFQHLSPSQKSLIFQVMTLKNVEAGDVIIKEGDVGDCMYLIDQGEFTVFKKDENGVSQNVFTYTNIGAAFGELSLMYGKPRAASVKAKTNGLLWVIGRQAFRAVLMKKQTQGLLKVFQGVSAFKNVSITSLQRICETCTEETFNSGDIVTSSDKMYWTVLVILEGSITLIPMDDTSEKQVRDKNTYIISFEIGSHFREAICTSESKTKCACLPLKAYLEVLGEKALMLLKEKYVKERMDKKRMSIVRKSSVFSSNDQKLTQESTSRKDFVLENVIISLGDFGYIGNFKLSNKSNKSCCVKVIAKINASKAKVDKGLLNEKSYLTALKDKSLFIPKFESIFQDSRILMLTYNDVFNCDLASIIYATDSNITNDMKVYYCMGIYNGLNILHENGLLNRYLNPSSIYITNEGIPKICDLRYAKKMDGSKSYTIIGDPLYFAPEIIGSQGYDYSADIWAYGVIVYEIFECNNPFGNVDTDETTVFKAITNYRDGALKYTSKTNEVARKFINSILTMKNDIRNGYKSSDDIKNDELFSSNIFNTDSNNWEILHTIKFPIDIVGSVDTGNIFKEDELDKFDNEFFNLF